MSHPIHPEGLPTSRGWHLIGVASGLGAGARGSHRGPVVFSEHPTSKAWMRARALKWVSKEMLTVPEPRSPEHRLALLMESSQVLSGRVQSSLKRGDIPLVLGGDHSCAVGTWSGVAHHGGSGEALGLLWLDAHLDAHTPETSPSGNFHGMPLACLLGKGYQPWLDISVAPQALSSPHVVLVGIRSYEPEEHAFLKALGIRIYEMPEIRERGLSVVLEEAFQTVRAAPGGYGVTVDLDAFDPKEIPGVATPVRGGLSVDEFCEWAAAHDWTGDSAFHALECVEFHPENDREEQTLRAILRIVDSFLGVP